MTGIVRNIQNDDLYLYLGDNEFKNLRTGKKGVVSDEMAKKVFVINVEATLLYHENPLLEDFIHHLNLKFDSNDKNKKS